MDGQRLGWADRPQGWDERRGCAGLLGLCRTVGAPGAPRALGALAAGSAAGFAHNPEERVRFRGGKAGTPWWGTDTWCPRSPHCLSVPGTEGPRRAYLRLPVGTRICFRGSPAGTVPPARRRPPPCASGSSGKSRRRTGKGSGKGRERKGLFRAVGVGGPAALKPSRCRDAAGGGSRGAGDPGAPGLPSPGFCIPGHPG